MSKVTDTTVISGNAAVSVTLSRNTLIKIARDRRLIPSITSLNLEYMFSRTKDMPAGKYPVRKKSTRTRTASKCKVTDTTVTSGNAAVSKVTDTTVISGNAAVSVTLEKVRPSHSANTSLRASRRRAKQSQKEGDCFGTSARFTQDFACLAMTARRVFRKWAS